MSSPAISNEKLIRQYALEKEIRTLGCDRYDNNVVKARELERETYTKYGDLLLRRSIYKTSEAIKLFLAQAETGGRGKRHRAVAYLRLFPNPDVIAFIGLRGVIDGLSRRRTLVQVAMNIGGALETELRFTELEEREKGLYVKLMRQIKQNTEHDKKSIAIHTMNKHDIEFDSWPSTDKLLVGQKVVELVLLATELCEVRTYTKGDKKRNTVIIPTERIREWIDKQNVRNAAMAPLLLPCIVPPKPYTNPTDGGYYTEAITPEANYLVKTRNKRYFEELLNRENEMPLVYQGVNAMAQTPWAINTAVLDVAKRVWDNGGAWGSLPPREDIPLPLCPQCRETITSTRKGGQPHKCFVGNRELLKQWKIAAKQIYTENERLVSQRLSIQKILWTAEKFADEEEIYFPVTCDFRGRAYYTPTFLTPQGADLAKGLLHFATGKPIDTIEAARWLAIHGANCYGEDKISFDDRVRWVTEHEAQIVASAANPDDTVEFWGAPHVDSPWQFLAWCFEWAAFLKTGSGFISRICVSLDGSANGIQHLSACLRDEVGAAAVNMTAPVNDLPSDIYGLVANRVTEKLEEIVRETKDEEERLMAKKWLEFGITRKLTKRPVMTLPYGSTMYSCRDYLEEAAQELMIAGHAPLNFFDPRTDELFRATLFLQKPVWEAIGEIVIAGRQVMTWLADAARAVAKTGVPVSWQTPTGFYVTQNYFSMRERLVSTHIAGSRYRLTLNEPTDKVDSRKQASGVSPNFIHSLDASAMMMTIDYALKAGVTHFGMVHDSYGTHAADVQTMAVELRRAFIDLYKNNDVLGDLRKRLIHLVGGDESLIPELPKKGKFDIAAIADATYFFA